MNSNIFISEEFNYILIIYESSMNIYSKIDILSLIKKNDIIEDIPNYIEPFIKYDLKYEFKIFKFNKDYLYLFFKNNKFNKLKIDKLNKNLDNYYNFYKKNNSVINVNLELDQNIFLKNGYQHQYHNNKIYQFKNKKLLVLDIVNNKIEKKNTFNTNILSLTFKLNYIYLILENKYLIKLDENLVILKEIELENIDSLVKIHYSLIKDYLLVIFKNGIILFDQYNLIKIKEISFDINISNLYEEMNSFYLITNPESKILKLNSKLEILMENNSSLMNIIDYKLIKEERTSFYDNCYMIWNIQGLIELKNGNINFGYSYIN